MRRWGSALRGAARWAAGAVLLTSGAPGSAAAQGLDQSSAFESGFTQFDQQPRAQVFTVGAEGALESVELYAAQLSPVGNLLVSIEEVVGNGPALPGAAIVLASGSLPLAAIAALARRRYSAFFLRASTSSSTA